MADAYLIRNGKQLKINVVASDGLAIDDGFKNTVP